MEVTAATVVRIKLLNSDLASKIAAGEVVERPASVVKELLENSLDAGASQIDLSIEGGGIQAIEVRDNGSGIVKEDLALALQQHATSKIHTAEDLANIMSLGFRGEALASINSVTKLSITSQTRTQEHAWILNNDQLSVAAHPVGTTVKVRDLFYNLPARRKFLRSERTEYQYVEETFRRIALSNFSVGFSLTHNQKLVKNLPACLNTAARLKRLIKLCGRQVLDNCLVIDVEQNGMRLWGWLATPEQARSQEQHQYFFINQRIIRDRLINHAIRQVYQPVCQDGKMPFYCLYLELDPVSLDVNVHPTKHEVRFRDARIIHAFITQTLAAVLQSDPQVNDHSISAYKNSGLSQTNFNSAYQVLSILQNKIIVAQRADNLILLDVAKARKHLLLQQMQADTSTISLQYPQTINLLRPLDLSTEFIEFCAQYGFGLQQSGPSSVLLRSIPTALQNQSFNLAQLFATLRSFAEEKNPPLESQRQILECVDFSSSINQQQAAALLSHFAPDSIGRIEYSPTQLQQLCT